MQGMIFVRFLRAFLCLIVVSLLSTSGKAQVDLVVQPPDAPNILGAWNSSIQDVFGRNTGYRCYDDFVMPSDKYVFRVKARGFYADTFLSNQQVQPNTYIWRLSIRQSAGNSAPGSVILDIFISPNLTKVTPTGVIPFLGNTYMTYDVSLDFPAIFLRGGQRYWVSIQSIHSDDKTLFAWLTSKSNPDYSIQYFSQKFVESPVGIRNNLAFTIIGDDAAIVSSKLDIPAFSTSNGSSEKNDIVQIPFYFKGVGNSKRKVIAKLCVDNEIIQGQEFSSNFDFDNSWHASGNFTIPSKKIIGKHKITVVAEGPNRTETESIESQYSGFNPGSDGWHFGNDGQTMIGALDGFCVGMSGLAREYYIKSPRKPIPAITSFPKRSILPNLYWDLYWTHIRDEELLKQTVNRRIKSYIKNNISDTDQINGELSMVKKEIDSGNIVTLAIKTSFKNLIGDVNENGHCILAIGFFKVNNIYASDDPNRRYSAIVIPSYDPNYKESVSLPYAIQNQNGIWSMSYNSYRFLYLGKTK